jgi:AraC-like DNA-binding protein
MFGKSEDRSDYQNTPRAVAAMARDLPDQFVIPMHSHYRSQLIFGCSGVITVTTMAGTWVVPSLRAVWIPGGVEHEMKTSGRVEMRTVYVDPDACRNLPKGCCVVAVSPLLRELIVAAVKLDNDYSDGGREDRIMSLILDEIHPAPVLPLDLPLPSDRRLLRICHAILEEPSCTTNLSEFGKQTGASQRTLERMFPLETGMTFSKWRQQARLLCGIRMLAEGSAISMVAMDLGYESPSAFSAMFRRALGIAPSEYFQVIDARNIEAL